MIDIWTMGLMVFFTIFSTLTAIFYSKKRVNELGGYVLEMEANKPTQDLNALVGINEYGQDMISVQRAIDHVSARVDRTELMG